MSDSNTNMQARRRLLKGIAVGSGAVVAGKALPEGWTRPIVDSVTLPAHAQTSGVFAGTTRGLSLLGDDTLLAGLAGTLVPEANAGTPSISSIDVSYCIVPNPARTQATVTLIVTQYLASGCNTNAMATVENVPVGGAPVPIPEPDQTGCGRPTMDVWFNESQLRLADLGLIPDAHAGKNGDYPTIQITAIDGMATGVFEFLGIVDSFTIGIGPCETFEPLCTGDCDPG